MPERFTETLRAMSAPSWSHAVGHRFCQRAVHRSPARGSDGALSDACAAFDFIHAAASELRIAVFGESLGTGVAVALAHERPVAGVLLNAPYASALRLFELRGLPLPYGCYSLINSFPRR